MPAILLSLVLATSLGQGRPGDILYIHHPPDPVNVRNGNFYLPVQDYYLPCFGFPLEVYRSYNSLSTRNGPFGRGWTFNYDLQIAVGEKAGLRVVEADGFVNEYSPADALSDDRAQSLKKIVAAKKAEDVKYTQKPEGKGEAYYGEYGKKLESDETFYKRQKEKYLTGPATSSPGGKYVSHVRGTTYLEVAKDGYVRTTETGRREDYTAKGQLVRISDRNDNRLTFEYDGQSRLSRVTDGCGQYLALAYNRGGKIAAITDGLTRKLSYEYDARDRLVSSVSLEGQKTTFAYDAKDRMTRLTFSDGVSTQMSYEAKTGYVTEQRGPGTKVTKYEYGKEGDRRWALVTDNEGTRNRYEYVDSQGQIVFVDKAGQKTVTTVSSCCGKPLSIKDAKGVGDEFTYDERGNLIAKKDATSQVTRFLYEPRFNQVSEIKSPDGSAMRFVYDPQGNLTFARNSTGDFIKLTYEPHGKIQTMTNHRDEQVAFAYSRFGKPSKIEKSVKKKFAASLNVTYDRTGEITNVLYQPKTPDTVQDIKDTLAGFLRLLKPSGLDFEI